MPIVRELTTLLNFKTDDAGLKTYEQKVDQTTANVSTGVVALGTSVGTFIGTIAAEWLQKITEFVSKAIESARELVRVGHQLGQTLRSGDVGTVLEDVFQSAQRVGVGYGNLVARFRTLDIAFRGTKVTSDVIIDSLENLQRALVVGGQTAEEQSTMMDTFVNAIKEGSFSENQFVEMLYKTPMAAKMLEQALGKTTAEVRKMAKDGKISSEVLVRAFAKSNESIRSEFEKTGITFAYAGARIGNVLTRLAAWFFGQGEGKPNWVAQWIVKATDAVVKFGEAVIKAMGGAAAAFEFMGYVAGTVLVGLLLANLPAIIGLITELGGAVLLMSLKWGLIAAAVLFAAMAIQDFVAWMRGDKVTFFGNLLGPFEEFKKKAEEWLAPFIKPIEEAIKLIQKLGKQFGIELSTSQAAVILVVGAFGGLAAVVRSVILAVRVLGFTIGLLNFIPLGGLLGALVAVAAAIAPIATFFGILLYPKFPAAATMTEDYDKYMKGEKEAGRTPLSREDWTNKRLEEGWQGAQRDAEGNIIGNAPGREPEMSWWDRFKNWYTGTTPEKAPPTPQGPLSLPPTVTAPRPGEPVVPVPVVPVGPDANATSSSGWRDQLTAVLTAMGAPLPPGLQVQSGAVAGGPTQQDVTQNANVASNTTLNITATFADMAAAIQEGVTTAISAATAATADATARALANSAPRVEAPTK